MNPPTALETPTEPFTQAFSDHGKRYRIQTPLTPRKWQNVHYSGTDEPLYYALVDNHGGGSSFFRDQAGNQATLIPERYLYFRDEDRGTIWNIAGGPVPTPVKNYRCDFTLPASEISSTCDGIEVSHRIFVPKGLIGEIWTVRLTNHSEVTRNILMLSSVSPDLGGFPVPFQYNKYAQKSIEAICDQRALYLDFRNPFVPGELYHACMAASKTPAAVSGENSDRYDAFLSDARPNFDFTPRRGEAMGAAWGAAFIMRHSVTLAPGETQSIDLVLACTQSPEQAQTLCEQIRDPHYVDEQLAQVEDHFQKLTATFSVASGNTQLDAVMSLWAKKQMGSYLGFKKACRDNLQVNMAYVTVDAHTAIENTCELLAHQYADGHLPHSFRPLKSLHYSDKPAWILLAVPELIKETGDFSLMERSLPFLADDGSCEAENGTVREHMLRAMRFMAKDTGPHGICLMHHADWNDGLDGLSRQGSGESVLSTLMFLAGLREIIALAEAAGDTSLRDEAQELYALFSQRVNEVCWDGAWYLRGFDGQGNKVGSDTCEEGKIFLNAQSWAVIAGIANTERQKALWSEVDCRLETPLGMRLAAPVFSQYQENIGCMSAQLPGYAENGCYNHAGGFCVLANCLSGRAEKAWELFRKILPGGPQNPIEQSGNEPYCFTNMFMSHPASWGKAGNPWRTGTSAWMYRNFQEFMLGIRKDYAGLRLGPCLAAELKTVKARRVYRENTYSFHFDNSAGRKCGVQQVTVDGKDWEASHLPLGAPGTEWTVEVVI